MIDRNYVISINDSEMSGLSALGLAVLTYIRCNQEKFNNSRVERLEIKQRFGLDDESVDNVIAEILRMVI